MRIAMFTDSWLPAMDGCIASILKFREGMEKRGHEVYIFAPADPTGKVKEDDRTFLFKSRVFGPYPEYRMALSMSARKDRLLRELDIDMIHTHGVAFMGFKAMMSSNQLKIPILLHFHTWVTEATQYYPVNVDAKFMERLMWIYLDYFCKRSDGVVAPSHNAIEELKKKVPGMEYSDWVFPGIDVAKFNPSLKGDMVRERHGLGDSEVFIHVGRVSSEKRLETILNAMAIIRKERPSARLLVVGTGPARDDYIALARKLHLEDRVVFAGFVPDEELPYYYAAADSFVIASTFETLGIVMIEALASGKPVAGVNSRVIPDVIKHGHNGYIFENDARDCAEKMLATLDAPDEMRANARSSVAAFDTGMCMDKMEHIYRRTEEVHCARMAKAGKDYVKRIGGSAPSP